MVVATLVLFEVGVRVLKDRLSLDAAYIETLPAKAEALDREPGCRVLFLGNSLTRVGVEPDRFTAAVSAAGVDGVSAAVVHQSDSRIVEWYRMFDRYYAKEGVVPDAVVLGYAHAQIQDTPLRSEEIQRLGLYYTSVSDIEDVFEHDLTGFDERAEFLLSKVSVSYAFRDKVARGVGRALIPGYNRALLWLNRKQRQELVRASGGTASEYSRLERFIRKAREQGTEVAVVAMPLDGQEVTVEAASAATERAGGTFLDAQGVEVFTDGDFADDVHLSPEGAAKYSDYIGAELEPFLRGACGARARGERAPPEASGGA